MEIKKETISKIIEHLHNSESKLLDKVCLYHTDEKKQMYTDFEFDIDGFDIYIELKVTNIEFKHKYYRAAHPEPNEEYDSISFDYEVASLWVDEDGEDVEAYTECVEQINESLDGHVLYENSKLL